MQHTQHEDHRRTHFLSGTLGLAPPHRCQVTAQRLPVDSPVAHGAVGGFDDEAARLAAAAQLPHVRLERRRLRREDPRLGHEREVSRVRLGHPTRVQGTWVQ